MGNLSQFITVCPPLPSLHPSMPRRRSGEIVDIINRTVTQLRRLPSEVTLELGNGSRLGGRLLMCKACGARP